MNNLIKIFIFSIAIVSLSSCLKSYSCKYTDLYQNTVVAHVEATSEASAVKKAENDETNYYWDNSTPAPICYPY